MVSDGLQPGSEMSSHRIPVGVRRNWIQKGASKRWPKKLHYQLIYGPKRPTKSSHNDQDHPQCSVAIDLYSDVPKELSTFFPVQSPFLCRFTPEFRQFLLGEVTNSFECKSHHLRICWSDLSGLFVICSWFLVMFGDLVMSSRCLGFRDISGYSSAFWWAFQVVYLGSNICWWPCWQVVNPPPQAPADLSRPAGPEPREVLQISHPNAEKHGWWLIQRHETGDFSSWLTIYKDWWVGVLWVYL